MCGIFGWVSYDGGGAHHSIEFVRGLVLDARSRGKDGWGVRIESATTPPKEYRSMGSPDQAASKIVGQPRVLANFRATPSTERVTELDLLQPYDGFVHNGTIANDKELASRPLAIDSMVIPEVFKRYPRDRDGVMEALSQLVGSYALLWFWGADLWWACNYKPLYTYGKGGLRVIGSSLASVPFFARAAIPPYSVGRSTPDGGLEVLGDIPRKQNKTVLVAASSGLDSTTAAYWLKSEGYEVTLVYFNYGQLAEGRESQRVAAIARHGGFRMVSLGLPAVLGGSIVEGRFHSEGVEGAEYAHDWVSARNLLMLATMTAYAETHSYGYLAFGGNMEEAGAYPDNEAEFAKRFSDLLPFSVQNGVKIDLLAPLSGMVKHEIVTLGDRLGVPWHLTWSCYSGFSIPCGVCGPCTMRKEAFFRAGVADQ